MQEYEEWEEYPDKSVLSLEEVVKARKEAKEKLSLEKKISQMASSASMQSECFILYPKSFWISQLLETFSLFLIIFVDIWFSNIP